MRTRPTALFCCLVLLFGLSACGGGDGGGTLVTTASPGGIWNGKDSATGQTVSGIVDESGQFHFIREDLTQFVGMATTSGTSISASFDGYAQVGRAFGDGSVHGTGTLNGTITARATMNLTYQFTTDAGAASGGTLDLTFDPLYNVASSLTAISGNYTDTASGATVSVTDSGAISSQDPASLCVLNGQVSIINAMYNAYAVSFAYANCTGELAVLNGVQFSGLGSLNNVASPQQLVIGVSGTLGSTPVALVVHLVHQ